MPGMQLTKEEIDFQKCINLLEDIEVRSFVLECLKMAPKYFWRIPASSTGKYHPRLSLGTGGLVRHTIKAVEYGVVLCRKNSIIGLTKDKIIASLILHDTCKAGLQDEEDHSHYPQHAYLPRKHYQLLAMDFPDLAHEIFDIMDSHMGQWSENPDKIPKTRDQRITHFADYLASRKNQPITDFKLELRFLKTWDDSIII